MFSRYLLLPIALLCFAYHLSAQHLFSLTCIKGDSYKYARSIESDPQGNHIVVGSYIDSLSFPDGTMLHHNYSNSSEPIFVAKMNAQGELIWVKELLTHHGLNSCVTTTDESGAFYIAGSYYDKILYGGDTTVLAESYGETDAYIMKLAADGSIEWYRTFGGSSIDFITAIAVDKAGNVYTTGSFRYDMDTDPSEGSEMIVSAGNTQGAFVHKLDNTGNFLWVQTILGGSIQNPGAITVDQQGNIYTAGIFSEGTDFDPDSEVEYDLDAELQPYVTSCYLHKMSSDGSFIWVRNTGYYEASLRPMRLAMDPNGDLMFLEDYFGSRLVKVNTETGFPIWIRTIGLPLSTHLIDMDLDNAGNIYLGGSFEDTLQLTFQGSSSQFVTREYTTDGFIQRINSQGELVWARQFDGDRATHVAAITIAENGDLISIGKYSDPTIFENVPGGKLDDPIFHFGDIYIARFNRNPCDLTPCEVLLFPNPTSGNLILQTTVSMHDARLSVFDMSGRIVKIYDHVSGPELQMDLSDCQHGVYLVQLEVNGKPEVFRILKL